MLVTRPSTLVIASPTLLTVVVVPSGFWMT
jgi:hypothetical protein